MSTSLDPGDDPAGRWEAADLEACFPLIDWFLPNANEIRALTGRTDVEDALQSVSPTLRGVVAKAGPQGAYGRWDGAIHRFPALPAESVDTTCAGDCFDAGFLFGLYGAAAGRSPAEAVGLANRLGALAVSGVGLPAAPELREEARNYDRR
jgi:sugar/nucleoside kinase (ribokinase family)